jgi:2-pyrone-4,6-dicarboxylate lactonase
MRSKALMIPDAIAASALLTTACRTTSWHDCTPRVCLVIDHFGHVEFEGGFERPVIRWVLDMLKHENWWMMVSNGNRDSKMDAGWDDAIPYGKAFIEAAPDRIVWGSDWPHPQWRKRMMNDAEEVELLYRYVDGDTSLVRKILVNNPARLHGFEK